MNSRRREILGWYGVGAILIAYLLVNTQLLATSSIQYHLLNLTGAIAIGFDAWKQKNFQPVVLNIVWAGVALVGIGMILGSQLIKIFT